MVIRGKVAACEPRTGGSMVRRRYQGVPTYFISSSHIFKRTNFIPIFSDVVLMLSSSKSNDDKNIIHSNKYHIVNIYSSHLAPIPLNKR